jgi:O-antigen/teichoic acid export membrane protein
MSLAAKVAYNTIVQVISKVITTILGLLAVAVMARYLGPIGFGEYTTAFTFLSFFGIIADLGLTLVTVQMISAPGADENRVVRNLLAMRLVSAAVLLAAAPLVAIFLPYSSAIRLAVWAALPSFLFTALNQILVGVFQKHLSMGKVSIAETVGRIVLFLGVVASAFFDWGLFGMMLSVSVGSAVNFILHLAFSLRYIKPGFSFQWPLWREVMTKSWPLALTIIFNLLYLKTDTLILSLMRRQYEVGIYGAAYKVIDILTTLPFMFAGVIMPIMTAAWLGRQADYFKKVLQKSFDLMVILSLPLFIGAQFVAEPIMVMVAGGDFAGSGGVLRILMAAAALVFLSCLLSHAMVAIGRQKEIIGSYFFTAATSVAGYLIFIPRYSYFGAAAVTVYSELTITIFMFYYLWRYARVLPKMSIVGKSLAASIPMSLSLWLLRGFYSENVWGLLGAILLAAVLYFSFIYIFRGIDKEDLKKLLRRERI